MFAHARLGVRALTLGVVVAALGATVGSLVTSAQLSQADLSNPDMTRMVLEQQVGRRAKIKLVSGQDLEGQVSRVGREGVLLTELTGQEFFDATVKLEQVAAVIVRRVR